MPGFRGLFEAALSAAFNSGPRDRPSASATPGESGDFLIGTALPFGNLAPAAGEPVWATADDLLKPGLLCGASGCGKTTTLRRLADATVADNVSLVEFDYRGDSFDRALRRFVAVGVPAERLTLIDFRNAERVSPMNLLGHGPGDVHTRAGVAYEALKSGQRQLGGPIEQ